MPGNRTNGAATVEPTDTDRSHAKRQQARSVLHQVDRDAQAFIQQRPFAAVVGAVIAGYLLARLASRS